MKVLDYSFWRPNIDDIKLLVDGGEIAGVSRYLAPLPNSKVIDSDEYAALRELAIPVLLNWESTGTSWQGGYEAGVREGRESRRQARVLGHPDSRPIVQSIDQGVPGSRLQTVHDYQRGFNDGGGCGSQGCYGTKLILDHLFDNQLIVVGWQTNARGWEGNAEDCSRASIYQRTSHSFPHLPANQYDESDVHLADWGQHPAPDSALPTREEGSMTIHPRRIAGRGSRVAAVTFDATTKTVAGRNGVDFADSDAHAWHVTHWPTDNPTGVTATAQLLLPVKGALSCGELSDGTGVCLTAAGDSGTFILRYRAAVLLPDPYLLST